MNKKVTLSYTMHKNMVYVHWMYSSTKHWWKPPSFKLAVFTLEKYSWNTQSFLFVHSFSQNIFVDKSLKPCLLKQIGKILWKRNREFNDFILTTAKKADKSTKWLTSGEEKWASAILSHIEVLPKLAPWLKPQHSMIIEAIVPEQDDSSWF